MITTSVMVAEIPKKEGAAGGAGDMGGMMWSFAQKAKFSGRVHR
jgi:hypothetical protein